MQLVGYLRRWFLRSVDVACSLTALPLIYEWLSRSHALFDTSAPVYIQVAGIASLAGVSRPFAQFSDLFWICLISTVTVNMSLHARDAGPAHGQHDRKSSHFSWLAFGLLLGAISGLIYAFRVPSNSRPFVLCYLAVLVVLVACYRLARPDWMIQRRIRELAKRRAVLIGSAKGIEKYICTTKSMVPRRQNVVGCLLTDVALAKPSCSLPVLGAVSDIGRILINDPIDEVVMIVSEWNCPWLATAVGQCDYLRVPVQIVHDAVMDLTLRDLKSAQPWRSPIPSTVLLPDDEGDEQDLLLWKRVIDVIGSAAALIVLSPLMALIAIAIKFSTPHLPVFYRWRVVGQRGRRFTGYKFTTMVADAEERKGMLMPLNEMNGPVFKMKADPRMTKLGKLLRKYSLNELPQLVSVLLADMSLVGPRPSFPEELVQYEVWQKRKLSVRPGITCFWQVRGRNAITSFNEWVNMDLEYIRKRSIMTDLTILFQTVGVVIRGTGS